MARNDRDLLELGGYWAYRMSEKKLAVGSKIDVNETTYEVIDTRHEDNGLDAMMVRNTLTGEVTMAFAGTQGWTDIATDAQLVTAFTPEQYKAAEKYFEEAPATIEKYRERINLAGEDILLNDYVSFLAGNSLGGGVANYVLSLFEAEYPDLFAVTLDPAPIPYGTTPGFNAMNYVAHTSPLFLATQAAGMEDRFPGMFEYVLFGLFSIAHLTQNHVGYNEKEWDEGNGIDDLLPFSIWGEGILAKGATYGFFKGAVSLDVDQMRTLTVALSTRMNFMREQLESQLDPVYETVQKEKGQLFNREATLKESMMENLLKFFTGLDLTVHHGDNTLQILSAMLMPKALQGMGGLRKPEVSRLPYIDEIPDELKKLKHTMTDEIIVEQLTDKNSGLEDGFVRKVEAHHEIIEHNLHVVIERWRYVEEGASLILAQFEALDEVTAAAISRGGGGVDTIPVPNCATPVRQVETSLYFLQQSAWDDKEEQWEANFIEFKDKMGRTLERIIGMGVSVAAAMTNAVSKHKGWQEKGKNKAQDKIENLRNRKELSTFPPDFTPEQIKASQKIANDARDKEIRELQEAIREIEANIKELGRLADLWEETRDELKKYQMSVPDMLEAMKPYIKQAIFKDTAFADVQIGVATAYYILDNAALLFHEIWNRICEHEAAGIVALEAGARSVCDAITVLKGQLERGMVS